jgi:hypothetical protein
MNLSTFKAYLNKSEEYHKDMAMNDPKFKTSPPTSIGMSLTSDELTVQAFHCGVKRDKSHYQDLKDDKFFNTWSRGFIATAYMQHTHLVLDVG